MHQNNCPHIVASLTFFEEVIVLVYSSNPMNMYDSFLFISLFVIYNKNKIRKVKTKEREEMENEY